MKEIIQVKRFYDRFKIYIHNTSWVIGERFITIALGFFVTVLVSRYLGPEKYGVLSYALSLSALFATAGHMGLSGLVVREIVKKPQKITETLGTSIVLKTFGISLGVIFLLLYAVFFERHQSQDFWTIVVISTSLLFRPLNVIVFWFQSQVQIKYVATARFVSFLIAAVVKIILIYIGAELLFFAFAHFLQVVFLSIFLIVVYQAKASISIVLWKFSFSRAKELLCEGWVVMLGALFFTVYMKMDQVMLKWFVGAGEVGIYSVAASISEAWYFLPTAIVASMFPKLIKLKESAPRRYNRRLQQIFEILFVIALIVALIMAFMAKPLIGFFFGVKYLSSAPILSIHIWAGLFVFMRAAFRKWILIEDALMFSLITQGFGAFANIGLNLLLIPSYGGKGAAIATLLSYAMASYFSLFFFKKSRPVFWMMSKAMLSPVRYPYLYVKLKLS